MIWAFPAHSTNFLLSFAEDYWSTDFWEVASDDAAWTHQYSGTSYQTLELSLSNVPAGSTLKFDWSMTSGIPGQKLWVRKGSAGPAITTLISGVANNVSINLDPGTYFLNFVYQRTSSTGGFSLGIVENVSLNTPPGLLGSPVAKIDIGKVELSWNSDESAKGRLLYGDTQSLGQNTPQESSLSASHSTVIQNWPDGMPLYYRIENTDAQGQVFTSALYRSYSAPQLRIQKASSTNVTLSWVADPNQWNLLASTNAGANYLSTGSAPTSGLNQIQSVVLPSETPVNRFFKLQRTNTPGFVQVSQ